LLVLPIQKQIGLEMKLQDTQKILIVSILLLLMPVFLWANNRYYGRQDFLNKFEETGIMHKHLGRFILEKRQVQDTIDIAPVPLERDLGGDSSWQKHPLVLVEKDSMSVAKEIVSFRGETINFNINSGLNYRNTSNFRTEKGLANYRLWRKKKEVLDSIQKQVEKWREEYANAANLLKRKETGAKIMTAENNLFALQKASNDLLKRARLAEIQYWDTVSLEKRVAFEQQLTNAAMQEQETLEKQNEKSQPLMEREEDISPDTAPGEMLGNEVVKNDGELVYKVQLGAYSRALPSYMKKLFDKLSYIRKIENYTNERGITIYSTGNLDNYADAVKLRNQVRQEGVKDAYIVPYYDGKSISLGEAKKLEPEK